MTVASNGSGVSSSLKRSAEARPGSASSIRSVKARGLGTAVVDTGDFEGNAEFGSSIAKTAEFRADWASSAICRTSNGYESMSVG